VTLHSATKSRVDSTNDFFMRQKPVYRGWLRSVYCERRLSQCVCGIAF
jgi:hypothetical protein